MLIPFDEEHAVPYHKRVFALGHEHVGNFFLKGHEEVLELFIAPVVELLHADLILEDL